MNIILSAILSYILLYGYTAIFLISYFAVLFPLPQTVVLLSGGAFAEQGYLNVFLVIFWSTLGNILGDITYFALARKYGKEFLMKIGLRKIIQSKQFIELEYFIDDNAGPTIFITRIIQIGTPADILCGLSKISFKKFMFYSVTGNIVYSTGVAFAGYILGNAWQDVTSLISVAGILLSVFVAIVIFSRIYFYKLKHKKL